MLHTETNAVPVPATRSAVPAVLRLEAAAILAAALAFYAHLDGGWGRFFALVLAPDLAFIVYLVKPAAGRALYNALHTYAAPASLALLALFADWDPGIAVALIWTAHIAVDRLAGYGLKYPGDGKNTHLQKV